MSELTAVVGWYGPYKDLKSAHEATDRDYEFDLCAVFYHKRSPAVGRARLLYVGSAESLVTQVTDHHGIEQHRFSDEQIASIWLGSIDSHMVPGRRLVKEQAFVNAVECAIIALFKPLLNEKIEELPSQPFFIINRWWSAEDHLTAVKKPVIVWPDVIECAGPNAPAQLYWLDQSKVRRIARPL